LKNRPGVDASVNADRLHFWTAAVAAVATAAMATFVLAALWLFHPTGLARVGYAVAGVVNLVAAVVLGLVVRQRLTGRGDVDEELARFGALVCLVGGMQLPNFATNVDEPQWRALFFGLGLVLAVTGVATVAVAPRAVRIRLGLGSDPTE
jgi:branched-subunit amino acid ABC-type transport system permease component